MAQISPLRRRRIEDMTVRNLSPATQRSYVHAVSKFSRYFGRSPDRLSLEEVRSFQVHLVSTGISWASLNQTVCALRFFCGVTLGGFLANGHRTEKLRQCRRLFEVPLPEPATDPAEDAASRHPHDQCPCCGGTMIILATRTPPPRSRPYLWNDSS